MIVLCSRHGWSAKRHLPTQLGGVCGMEFIVTKTNHLCDPSGAALGSRMALHPQLNE